MVQVGEIMQNEATNTAQQRVNRLLKNPHLADRLRRDLLGPKTLRNGGTVSAYSPESAFAQILESLTDEQLITKYIANGIRTLG
jgi:hypothetical protein